jgi:LacI family transcriptional regulator
MASQRKNRPTLRDVAHEAGVGTTTVSRVINGGHYVAPKMLARIQRVMVELGYQPNQAARSLKSEQSHTIGVIVPSITDPFFARFAEVAEAHARGRGYAIILLTSRDTAELELDDLRIFQRHRVDGLLIVPPRTSPRILLKNVRQLGIPTVAFDRPIAKEFSTVLSDNYKGAQDAVRHLISHRRKRILCIGGDQKLHTIQERLRGASDALAAAGCETILEPHASDYASAEASIAKHLIPKRSIDAIFGLHNHATVMAYEVLQNLKVSIPDTISLIGFDDFAFAATLRPSITVVRQSIEELALTAIRLLFSRMDGEISPPQQIEIACDLVLRQSCGCEKAR